MFRAQAQNVAGVSIVVCVFLFNSLIHYYAAYMKYELTNFGRLYLG